MLKLVESGSFEVLCSSSDGCDRQADIAHSPLSCGNEAGPTNPRQTLSPNKRLQPNPVPELFSVTLQAEKEMENLDMDVSAMNPQRNARGALQRSPALSPTEMVCRLLRAPQEKG